jgi:hypothetical protein
MNKSRSSRGSARNGAVLGSSSARSKILQNKVLHLAWSNQGPAYLISLRKPREWVDTILARLRDNTTVVYLNESKEQR